jgi:hypothetical protein
MRFASGLLALVAVASGCGPRTATMAGRVTYQERPVVWGTVTLRAADGSVHQAGINLDGTYELEQVPVGAAKVGVTSPDPKPSARARGEGDARVPTGMPRPPREAWFPLPARLADPATSGVTLEVGSGSGDINLK